MPLKTLRKLPRDPAQVWLGDRRPTSIRVRGMGPLDLVIWIEQSSGRILAATPVEHTAGPEGWLRSLEAAARSNDHRPRLPCRILISDPQARTALEEALAPLGVGVGSPPASGRLDEAFESLEEHLGRPNHHTYLEGVAGLLPAKKQVLADFYVEAGLLFQAEPWQHADDRQMIFLEGLTPEPLLVSVLGSAGIQLGLAVFLTPRGAALAVADSSPREFAREPSLSILFTSERDIPALAAEARRHGWPLAEDRWVPLAAAVLGKPRFPTLDEMELLSRTCKAVRLLFQEADRGDRELDLAPDLLVRAHWPVEVKPARRRRKRPAPDA